MKDPLVMFVSFNSQTWHKNEGSIVPKLKGLNEDEFLDLAFGAWVFDASQCYSTIHYLRDFLHRKDIPYFVMPLPDPFECAVTQEVAKALTEKTGASVYNLEIES